MEQKEKRISRQESDWLSWEMLTIVCCWVFFFANGQSLKDFCRDCSWLPVNLQTTVSNSKRTVGVISRGQLVSDW